MKFEQLDNLIGKISEDQKGAHIFHRAGFKPIALPTEMGNTGYTLIAEGWRNYDQLMLLRNKRKSERSLKLVQDSILVTKKITKPKNPKTKLFKFLNGVYKKLIS